MGEATRGTTYSGCITTKYMSHFSIKDLLDVVVGPLVVGIVVGVVVFYVGKRETDRRVKSEAIRDLMTNRGGDFSNPEFRKALNKVSITFSKDDEVRKQIRELYELINSQYSNQETIKRKIVGVIY